MEKYSLFLFICHMRDAHSWLHSQECHPWSLTVAMRANVPAVLTKPVAFASGRPGFVAAPPNPWLSLAAEQGPAGSTGDDGEEDDLTGRPGIASFT
jgi:hypothetical protein